MVHIGTIRLQKVNSDSVSLNDSPVMCLMTATGDAPHQGKLVTLVATQQRVV
jgi:hypothetical protein